MTSQHVSRRLMGTSQIQRARLELVAAEFLTRTGERLRERREEMGLSRGEVARKMPGKVSENQIYRWEKGQHQPNPDTLEELAKVLERDVYYFMSPPPDDEASRETPDPFATNDDAGLLARLDQLDTKITVLDQKISRLLPDPADPPQPATIEQMVDTARVLLRTIEEASARLGRDISKRDLQARAARGPRPAPKAGTA